MNWRAELKKLAAQVLLGRERDSAKSDNVLAEAGQDAWEDVFRNQRITVQRHAGEVQYPGSATLAELRDRLLAPRPGLSVEHAKFKVVGVDVKEAATITRQLLELSGSEGDEFLELHATLTATWDWQMQSTLPVLKSMRLEEAQRVISRFAAGRIFSDRTGSVLAKVPSYPSELLYGVDFWLQRLDKMLTDQFGHHGLAIGDVNGDALDDVYVCQPGGLPNLLLVQQPDGTVREVAATASLDILDLSRSALLIDLDNDGDQDLVLATSSHLLFFANDPSKNGHLQFRLAAKAGVRDANSISAIDIELDGDLDVYACVYSGDGGESRASPTPLPIHDARNGGRNVLLQNVRCEGTKWTFIDATEEFGLDADNRRWSYAASWEDYDNDGDSDLYVANDFGRNNLYRSEGGRFIEASRQAGLDEAAFGMSVSWGDYDRDGWMDVYVSNMFSGAGNRIVPQPSFQAGATDELKQQLRYAARGNSLFRNLGNGSFEDVSELADVTLGRWAWGSLFADLDNDGWEDLIVGNGFVTRENTGDL